MNQNNSWKKTEEIEINLVDLLKKLCVQWKQVLVCAVVFACLLGGYKYVKDNRAVQTASTAELAEGVVLTDAEQKSVTAAIELAEEIDGIEKYLEESIVMNIDPYHKDRVVLLYSIDDATKQTKQKIIEAYLNFLSSGGAIDALKENDSKKWDMDKSYLSELVSAYQRENSSYQIIMNDSTAETLLYIETTGKDAEMAGELAADIQTVLESYYPTVKEIAGKHTLTLLNSEKSMKPDSGLMTAQHDKRALLTTNLTTLKNLTDAFSEDQKLLYENAIIEEDEQPKAEEAASAGISKKYILLGFVGGIFLYCCVYACWYLLRDTVKSMEEIKDYYNFPFYGGIVLKKGTKGNGQDLTGSQKDAYEREKAQMMNRVRLACQKQETSTICLATDFSLNEQEKECLSGVSKQLNEWGVNTVLGENISGNISVWDELTKAGIVLMIYKIGTTTHQMIDEEMNFYLENDIAVIGAVALESK